MSHSASSIDSRVPATAIPEGCEKTAVDWLTWLSALLVDVNSMYLLDTGSRQIAQWPISAEAPDGALQFALRAFSADEVIRSRLADNSDHVLLAIPLNQSKYDARAVLLLSCLCASAERQKKLVHLARWASEYRPCLSGIPSHNERDSGKSKNTESLSDRYLESLLQT